MLPTLIQWWVWLRAPIVQEWKKRSRVKWDTSARSNDGAERTASEALLEKGKYNYEMEEMDQDAVTLVCWLGQSIRGRCRWTIVWAWTMHFGFRWRILRVLCVYFRHLRRMIFEGCVTNLLLTTVAIPLDPRGVVYIFELRCKTFWAKYWSDVPNINLHLLVTYQDVQVPQDTGKLKNEIRKTKLTMSLTEEWEESKSKLIVSYMYFNQRCWHYATMKELGSQTVWNIWLLISGIKRRCWKWWKKKKKEKYAQGNRQHEETKRIQEDVIENRCLESLAHGV